MKHQIFPNKKIKEISASVEKFKKARKSNKRKELRNNPDKIKQLKEAGFTADECLRLLKNRELI